MQSNHASLAEPISAVSTVRDALPGRSGQKAAPLATLPGIAGVTLHHSTNLKINRSYSTFRQIKGQS